MLFDLRSRGRRRTVQVVYLGLAVILGGGLILFGVGTGSGTGGLLNAFTGNGSGNSQNQAISQQEKNADKQVKLNPDDAAAWGELVTARWADASTGSNYDSTTGAFTTAGKRELAATTDAWQHYTGLVKNPSPTLAELAARAYGNLGNYAAEANAWEIGAAADPSSPHGFECLAAAAYAAKQTRKGDLALNKALSLTPKLSRATLKSEVQAAKTTPSIAASC
jgi:hypothetical protein